MAVIGYIQTGLAYGGDTPSTWDNMFAIQDTSTSFSELPINVGLSWRKFGTTGGGPANFSADETNHGVLRGNISVGANNSITLSGLVMNTRNGAYTVTQPGTNIVGARFSWTYPQTGDEFFGVSRPNNSPVGNSIWYETYGTYYPANQSAPAAGVSGAYAVMRVHENATGTIARRFFRIVNNLTPPPQDYRPGQDRVSGVWESHNRGSGKADIRASGSWTTMRTQAGTGDPPLIYRSGSWVNQAKIGANQ